MIQKSCRMFRQTLLAVAAGTISRALISSAPTVFRQTFTSTARREARGQVGFSASAARTDPAARPAASSPIVASLTMSHE